MFLKRIISVQKKIEITYLTYSLKYITKVLYYIF